MPRLNAFRSRFFWKNYSAFALLFLITAVLISWIVFIKVGATINGFTLENLRSKAEFLVPMARSTLQDGGSDAQALLAELGKSTQTRITLIKEGGQVIADSDFPVAGMENHWSRPEVQEALSQTFGLSERFSVTSRRPLIYLARTVSDTKGQRLGVVRVSLSVENTQQYRWFGGSSRGDYLFGRAHRLSLGLGVGAAGFHSDLGDGSSRRGHA